MLSPKEFQELYISMYEGMSDDAKEMRRLAAAERRAGKSDRMDAKTAAKYAGSEAKSAEREDKKSKGKHIHGYAIGEAKDCSYSEPNMKKRASNNEKAIADMKKTKAHADMVKAARKHFDEESEIDEAQQALKMKKTQKEEVELELRAHLRERALDTSEKKEKEHVFKAIKPSKLAKSYPEKSPKELKSLRYAISTAQAKKNMDTSKSDKRYGVEK